VGEGKNASEFATWRETRDVSPSRKRTKEEKRGTAKTLRLIRLRGEASAWRKKIPVSKSRRNQPRGGRSMSTKRHKTLTGEEGGRLKRTTGVKCWPDPRDEKGATEDHEGRIGYEEEDSSWGTLKHARRGIRD